MSPIPKKVRENKIRVKNSILTLNKYEKKMMKEFSIYMHNYKKKEELKSLLYDM